MRRSAQFELLGVALAAFVLAGCGGGGGGGGGGSSNNGGGDDTGGNGGDDTGGTGGDDTGNGGALTAFDTPFFFVANDGASGVTGAAQLWRTNGLDEGTYKLADPASGGADPEIQELTPFEDGLYFIADDGAGAQLWFSDGTEGGAEKVTSLDEELGTAYLTVMGDYLYFSATHDGSTQALWRTDGADVELVKDINPGSAGGTALLTVMNDTLYFIANDGAGHELWQSDGTEAGTARVAEINPGGAAFSATWARRLEVVGDHLYFNADDGDELGLWRSDGTEAGTERVTDIAFGAFGARAITAVGDTLMFKHNPGTGVGIYKTDGTEGGTTFGLADGTQVFGDDVAPMAHLNGSVFFQARDANDADDAFGNEPWISDGTEAGSMILKDINPGSSHSNPSDFLRIGDHVYFAISRVSPQIWRTDGTTDGTVVVDQTGIGTAGTLIAADGGNVLLIFDGLRLYRLHNGERERIKEICTVFGGGCIEYLDH